MAAPEYVPLKPTDVPRAYSSPPRRPEPWMARRPGEVVDSGQPHADRFGSQGPDQGYALKLLHLFDGKIHVSGGEHIEDAEAGCVGVALKRASIFGRAPMVHDLTVAFTLWGFLDESPPAELVDIRRTMFAEVHLPQHYDEQRAVVDAVPESTLRMSPTEVAEASNSNWRSLLDLD
jgi:hypothetical protein